MTERMAAELTWHAQQSDVRARLDCPKDGGPPFLQVALLDGDAELYWLGGPNAGDPPQSPILRYDRRPSECGECSMYTFAGAFDSLDAALGVGS